MVKIPRVALFDPEPSYQQLLLQLFQRRDYSLRVVKSVFEITQLAVEEGAPFDAIVVPLMVQGFPNGVTASLQVKGNKLLNLVPIVALSTSADRAVIEAFYGAGADFVFSSPFDADRLYYQILALMRLRSAFEGRLNEEYRYSGLQHPIIGAFDALRQPTLLCDGNQNVFFVNRSAQNLFGIPQGHTEFSFLSQQFGYILKEHTSSAYLHTQQGLPPPSSSFRGSLLRFDGQSFNTALSVTTLQAQQGPAIGYSITLTDLEELNHLSNTLILGQRTRTLALMTSVACIGLLEDLHRKTIITPFHFIGNYLKQTPKSSDLNASLTSLLEILDSVFANSVVVRVKVEQEVQLAVSPTDLFQLTGNLLFHAVEHVGIRGELFIHTSAPENGTINLTVIAQANKITPFLPDDLLAALVQSDFANFEIGADAENKLNLSLAAAESIAQQAGSTVLYQRASETVLKLRVKLPVLQNAG